MGAEGLMIIKPGSSVLLPNGTKAVVTQVSIHPQLAVSYQVAWWDDNVRKQEWLEDFEVAAQCDQIQMGFRS